VAIPAIVDLPQIVVSTGPNQVTIDEFNRWASPLRTTSRAVVAENLVQLLGTRACRSSSSRFRRRRLPRGDRGADFESAPARPRR
jgi:uncharacterized lipoprotein YmbA